MSARRRRHVVDFLFLLASLFLFCCRPAQAQLVNGQFFTSGLSIIDAPAPNSQQNSGGTMSIAVDISGDGKLQTLQNTQMHSLTIFLVSSTVGVNVSVSDSPAFLAGEPGSTVKHLNYVVPTCLPAGEYNLTFYECFEFQGTEFFAITPIPVKLNSQAPSDPANFGCISPPPTQALALPQPDGGLPSSPWLPGSVLTSTTQPSPTSTTSTPPSLPPSSSSPPAQPPTTTESSISISISIAPSPSKLAPTVLPSSSSSPPDSAWYNASFPTQGLIVPVSAASPGCAGASGHPLPALAGVALLIIFMW